LLGVAIVALSLAFVSQIFFLKGPLVAPSLTAHRRRSSAEEMRRRKREFNWKKDLVELLKLFQNKGFIHTVLAFGIAECVVNSFSDLMSAMLEPEGFDNTFISWMGTSFILACLISSGLIGFVVDRWHNFKVMILALFFWRNSKFKFFCYSLYDKYLPFTLHCGCRVLRHLNWNFYWPNSTSCY